MANKKANRFSIFKEPEHDCTIDEGNPDLVNTTDLLATFLSGVKRRVLMRLQILVGENDETKIPHFDNIVGLRLYMNCSAVTATPNVHPHELNDQITKFFIAGGATWNVYRDEDKTAGCPWKKSGGGGDYNSGAGTRLAGDESSALAWSSFEVDDWAAGKNFSKEDWICQLIKENEEAADEAARFISTANEATRDSLPINSWRGFEFDGASSDPPTAPTGNVYRGGRHTRALLGPIYEIIYDDDIPEQPTDFKLVPNEDEPERVGLEFSESPDEDVQGYMLFATTELNLRDFDGLKWLKYDTQTVNFTIGSILTGQTNGATAVIVADQDDGTTGVLILRDVNGEFENAETITDADTGSADADGTLHDMSAWGSVDKLLAGEDILFCAYQSADWVDDAWNTYKLIMTSGKNKGKVYTISDTNGYKYLNFDAEGAGFLEGDTLTGGVTGDTGVIIEVQSDGTEGRLLLSAPTGTFQNNEAITDGAGGNALADGVTYAEGILSITEGLTASELGINDMFIIVKPYTAIAGDISAPAQHYMYAVETNRGYYWNEAPSENYPIWIKDFTQLDPNEKYFFFIQAIDHLGMGERGDKSNIIEMVIPEIAHAKDFNIASVNDDDTGTDLDIYEEVYPAIYTVGLNNEETPTPGTSITGLKDKIKMEIETGEFRYLLDTYVTTLTAEWNAGTTISLDLDTVPKTFFRVGQKVVIIDRDSASPPNVIFDIRTITGVGDNSITVNSANGHTFTVNTSQIYPVKTFMYTKTGSKSGIIKARVMNEEGFPSAWQTPNTPPAPIDIPGIGSLKAGPTLPEKLETVVNFNMNLSRSKDSEATISKYVLDKDDGNGETDYDEPVQSLQSGYASTGVKQPLAFIYDSNNIISPGLDMVLDGVAIGPVFTDDTILARTHDAGSPLDVMNAVGDELYLAFDRPFDGVYIDFAGFFVGLTFDKEYWDGSAWQTLAVTDDTANMTQNGKITWDKPSDWGTTDGDAVSGAQITDTTQRYFVRFTVTGLNVAANIFIIVPLELGNNYAELTVIDPTVIDIDSVFVDGFEKHVETHPRRIYAKSGILGHLVKQGIKLIPTFSIQGHSHTINDNYLSGFDASGDPVFGGAANTDNRLDDLQILQNIIDNGRLVTFKDDAGGQHTGYLASWEQPTRMEGMPVSDWSIPFIPDPNR